MERRLSCSEYITINLNMMRNKNIVPFFMTQVASGSITIARLDRESNSI
jgi:hypothetical protein